MLISHDIRSDLYDIHTQHLFYDWCHVIVLVFCQSATEDDVVLFDEEYMSRLIRLSAPTWADVKYTDAYIHELRGE